MTRVPDYTEDERNIVLGTANARWRKDPVDIQLADVEVQLDPAKPGRTECPALFWLAGNCSFVIIKTGPDRYRGCFFYRELEQMGTGIEEYDDLQQCVLTLLQAQADHESVRSGTFPENNDSGF